MTEIRSHQSRLAALTAMAGLAGVLALSGCVSGAPATVASAAAARLGTAASSGVHFIDYSVNSDGPDSSVIVTGAIGDWGHGVTVYPDGKVDPDHTSELEFRLTHGSFRISFGDLDKEIVHAYDHWPANRRTCSASIAVTGTTPIVAGSGTGSYRGVTGQFTTTATIDEIDSTKPACLNGTGAFLAQISLVTGTGTISS
jgi:hypothetical protein